ncbi:MAG: hypothetical protein QNK37_01640 [Acidobacteriota bacterium]|nr:hypothetical protein [Acidobacteriota bacterium]
MVKVTTVSPHFKIKLGGKLLDTKTAKDVLRVELSDYLEGAATFTLLVNIWDADRQEFKLIDDKKFAEGVKIEIMLGYVEKTVSLIKGEITGLEPQFHDGESPTMEVVGYDLLSRFQRGRVSRTFTDKKDSDVAKLIAREFGLKPRVDDTGVVHKYLFQRNQSNIDFLRDRARRIGYELNIEDGQLRFRKKIADKKETLELEYGRLLRSFYPRLTTIGQITELSVQGWDPMTKKPIAFKAQKSHLSNTMGGKKHGVAVAVKAFKKREDRIVDIPVRSKQEATQIAKGMFNDVALDYINGEAVSVGDTRIRSGEVVKLTKMGKRFSGRYYITQSTHTVDRVDGYVTRFKVERNAT